MTENKKNDNDVKDFFNNLSHEIRTPVQAINAIAKGLVQNWNNFDNATNYDLATKIASNSGRLFSLVENILEMSNIKSGKIDLNYSKISPLILAQEMVEECKNFYLNYKNIKFEIISHLSSDIKAPMDENKIIQVLRNLLSNAIKASKEGTITISLTDNEEEIKFSITDEGIGIPEDDLNKLFVEIGHTSNTKNNIPGVGIGLIVAKSIVTAHGGSITAENNKDKGANFSFTIPKSSNPAIGKQIKDTNFKNTKDAQIVIIDDEETCLLSFSMMLLKTNYDLHLFSNPIQALDFLKSNPNLASIILLDVMMPEMNGIELLRLLKSHNILKTIPVIMQSGIADQSQIDEAISLGAEEFLRKPFTKEQIIESIEKILSNKS
ncbi:MAG UNVERIFIED_CONTAM: hybrid sensor histidine kinase/response regulator [Planctomycetaceae bacterium]|jgi:two-component system sensor histidine kinase ChiS